MAASLPQFLLQRRAWAAVLGLWLLLVGFSLSDNLRQIQHHNLEVAGEGARNIFRMVVLTRRWNSNHGGVFLLVSPQIQPNPYLESPDKVLTTTDGRQLTLVNPAYMTRMLGEMTATGGGPGIHITSLKPIRPGNAPDAWEAAALQGFERGARERIEVVEPEGWEPHLRFMAPLLVESSCLKCHGSQGYKVGDVRGGISVNLPYGPIRTLIDREMRKAVYRHVTVFVLLGAITLVLLELLRRRWLELDRTIVDLEQTRGELIQSEKMASLGRLVSGFAHEINTPLGVAVGAVSQADETRQQLESLLSHDEVGEAELRPHLDALAESDRLALANLRRATGLVHSFKRTSIDQSVEEPREFALVEVIGDVLKTLANLLKRGVEVTVSCPEDLRLVGTPGVFDQILTNLVVNSCSHGFAENSRPGHIRIDVRQTLGEDGAPGIELRYADDGAGMDTQTRERVFEPFYTTRRGAGGSGLGLYICYNLVTGRLGGSITCDSAPGAGATFTLRFPFHAPDNRSARPHDSASLPSP